MSISIFYLLDPSFMSAEKVRWCLLAVRSAGKVKYSQFTKTARWKKDVRKNDRLINNNYLESVKLNSNIIKQSDIFVCKLYTYVLYIMFEQVKHWNLLLYKHNNSWN